MRARAGRALRARVRLHARGAPEGGARARDAARARGDGRPRQAEPLLSRGAASLPGAD